MAVMRKMTMSWFARLKAIEAGRDVKPVAVNSAGERYSVSDRTFTYDPQNRRAKYAKMLKNRSERMKDENYKPENEEKEYLNDLRN